MRSLLLVVAAAPALTACLGTPPAASSDAAAHDGAAVEHDAMLDAAPPDAMLPRCALGECEQLLAIGLWRHEPTDLSSVALLRRDAALGTWERLANPASSPDGNIFDLDWGDCCGPAGGPDDLPDLLAANFYYLHVSQLRRPDGVLGTTPFVMPPQPDSPGGQAQGIWFDVDGDDDLDILAGRPNLRWHRNTTPGFDSPVTLDAAVAEVSIGSWDDEPAPELLLIDHRDPAGAPAGRGTGVLDQSAGGAWDSFVPVLPDERFDLAIWCDVYDTMHPDLVVASYYGIRIFSNLGAAVSGNWIDVEAEHMFTATEQNYPPMACGDLDGNGRDDLVVATSSGLRAVMHGTSATTLIWDPATVATEATFITDVVLADPDHDDLPDLLVTLGDDVAEEDTAEPVAYLLPNRTTTIGEVDIAAPEPLLSARVDGMSLAYVEFLIPAPPR